MSHYDNTASADGGGGGGVVGLTLTQLGGHDNLLKTYYLKGDTLGVHVSSTTKRYWNHEFVIQIDDARVNLRFRGIMRLVSTTTTIQ